MPPPRRALRGGGRQGSPALCQRLLYRAQDRLAVRVAPLVVADLAQLRRAQVGDPARDLARGQVVVAEYREAPADPGRASRLVHLAQHAVGRPCPASPPPGIRGSGLELLAAAAEQLLEV